MDNNNLENNIKESFDHYLPDLNHDEIWDNIEPQLKKKKKRRFFFIWFFGGMALIGLFMANKYYWSNSTINEQNISESISVVETPNNNDDQTNTSSFSDLENKTEINKDSQIIEELRSSNLPTSTKSKSISKQIIKNKSPLIFEKKTENSEIIILKETPQQITETEIPPKEVIDLQVQEQPLVSQPINDIKTIEKESILEETTKVIGPTEEIPEIKKEEKELKLIKPLKNKIRFFLQPTFSAVVPIKSLKQRAGFGENQYLKTRKETERQLEAFAIGLNLHLQTRRGFVMMSGIEIQRLNGRYKLNEKTETQEVGIGIVSITENALGETIRTSMGPTITTRRTTKTQRFYNHHTFVNVPIGIGKFWNKPKYDIRFMTGLDINIYHNFKGLIQGPNWDLDMRSKNSSAFRETFKRKTGMGFWLSTEFHKSVNKKFSWSIAPKIQIPFSNITQDDYILRQNFSRFSITLGANFLIAADKEE